GGLLRAAGSATGRERCGDPAGLPAAGQAAAPGRERVERIAGGQRALPGDRGGARRPDQPAAPRSLRCHAGRRASWGECGGRLLGAGRVCASLAAAGWHQWGAQRAAGLDRRHAFGPGGAARAAGAARNGAAGAASEAGRAVWATGATTPGHELAPGNGGRASGGGSGHRRRHVCPARCAGRRPPPPTEDPGGLRRVWRRRGWAGRDYLRDVPGAVRRVRGPSDARLAAL
ncbi:MAG: hypothetical protein AVDCRST_MAG77-3061, partial [uncultured Chloroflexi bacterium]